VGTFHAVGPNSGAVATATAAATTYVSSSGPRRVHIKRALGCRAEVETITVLICGEVERP
jgi:hypothetical protein